MAFRFCVRWEKTYDSITWEFFREGFLPSLAVILVKIMNPACSPSSGLFKQAASNAGVKT